MSIYIHSYGAHLVGQARVKGVFFGELVRGGSQGSSSGWMGIGPVMLWLDAAQ